MALIFVLARSTGRSDFSFGPGLSDSGGLLSSDTGEPLGWRLLLIVAVEGKGEKCFFLPFGWGSFAANAERSQRWFWNRKNPFKNHRI